jgi:hypothetical protein
MGLWSDFLDEAKWYSEYESNFTKCNKEDRCSNEVRCDSNNYECTKQVKCCDGKKTAGLSSGIRQESPYMYAWSAVDNKFASEYTSNFDKKEEFEKAVRLLPIKNTISPFYADDAGLTAKWKSEYGSNYAIKKEDKSTKNCNKNTVDPTSAENVENNDENEDEESFVFIEHDDIDNKIEYKNVPVTKSINQQNNDIPGLEISIYGRKLYTYNF